MLRKECSEKNTQKRRLVSVKQNVSKLTASLLFRFANITVGTSPSEEMEEKPEVSIWRIYTAVCNVLSIMN